MRYSFIATASPQTYRCSVIKQQIQCQKWVEVEQTTLGTHSLVWISSSGILILSPACGSPQRQEVRKVVLEKLLSDLNVTGDRRGGEGGGFGFCPNNNSVSVDYHSLSVLHNI